MMAIGGFWNVAFAQPAPSDLIVVFEQTPLFSGANIVPGDGTSRTVIVTNNSGTTQTIITSAANFSACGSDCLADVLTLTVTDGSNSYFASTLNDFYNAGEVVLGTLANGETKTFTYTVLFPTDAGNNFQNQSTSFDLLVGFQNGQTIPDNPLIAVGGGGGGGSGGSRHLLYIFNERNETPLPNTTSVTVYWNTNIPATSQVIYGPAGSDYVLDLENLPYLGYPFGTDETAIKVVDHTMIMTGLVPGQAYKYRVVSRASPPTVSYEYQFTVPTTGEGAGATAGPLGLSNGQGGGNIFGTDSEDSGATSTEGEVAGAFDESQLAAAFASGWGLLSSWWWLWILLILLAASIFQS